MKTVEIDRLVKNIGKTPAKSIRIDSELEVLNKYDRPSFVYPQARNVFTTHILFPEASTPFVISIPSHNARGEMSGLEMSPTLRTELQEGSKYTVIFGYATYSDVFGKHWVQWCEPITFTPGDYSCRECVDYNDTGDGENPTAPRFKYPTNLEELYPKP
jgi:hypothetical protein